MNHMFACCMVDRSISELLVKTAHYYCTQHKLSAPLSVVLSSCSADLPELHLMMEGRPVDHCDDPILGPVERVSHMTLQGPNFRSTTHWLIILLLQTLVRGLFGYLTYSFVLLSTATKLLNQKSVFDRCMAPS